ncbi:MAG: TIGR00282 family metallophosphoesterase [Chloroflexi bacterium]|nr:TIGR00282 family metallophosphoesterase [Chloroflexota bacterium]
MRFLMMGDVVGSPGRRAVQKLVPELRDELKLDLVIANAENVAHGSGMTPETVQDLLEAGVDVLTSGNHALAKREIIPYLDSEMPIIRPLNYPPGSPGRGYVFYRGVLIVNVIGRVFMQAVDDPFRAMDRLLDEVGSRAKTIIVDCHTEATSEANGMGWYLNGRVSAVLGTHTHIGTVDARILPKGTAYITDIGMVGPRDSVIGNDVGESIQRFLTPMHIRLNVASGPVLFHSVVVEVDDETGRATSIKRVDREVP